ncbi:GSK3B-interacting protein-like [Tubulanus polymorphus]|uniref:GSK3B-interacting protein-like n=1 Tax=Tubulanus polymorphus TaxID=672921 RepID=UPI003DA40AD6
MDDSEYHEKILVVEVSEAIKEIKFAVEHVEMSKKLPSTEQTVYFNMKTKEKDEFCVELSVQGFRIAGKEFDIIDDYKSRYYETIYALLDHVSPGYRNTFGDALTAKLNILKDKTDTNSSQDDR